ncbi:MAG TPA: XdhC family protein [Longimicrobiales bacterium]|nr:XdhC family protein [Longimicrobiales bacterium]
MVGVVPCAGLSFRMGRSKALMDAGGTPFLSRVVNALRDGGCDDVLVVVRASHGPEAVLARELGARVLVNTEPEPGPISSLRVALAALDPSRDGVVLLPVDHPRVRADTVAAVLREAAASGASIVVPRHGARRGHPVLFRRDVFPELLDPALEGGARTVVRRVPARVAEVAVDDPGILQDIDPPGEYHAAFPQGGLLSPAEAAAAVIREVEAGHPVVAVTRLDAHPRRRLVVLREGGVREAMGSLGDPEADAAADAAAREILRGQGQQGRMEAGGSDLYLELHQPTPEMIIVGAGHIAQPLSAVGALLGFRVTVADDRPDFATRERFPQAHRVVRVDFADPFADIPLGPVAHLVLVTRGHKYDYECLRRVLLSPVRPRYLGMIGSRRRVRATFEQLLAEGIPRDRLEMVRAPVGLDLGAETPGEIAVAVAGEMVLEWRGGSGAPLRRVERVLERFFPQEGP